MKIYIYIYNLQIFYININSFLLTSNKKVNTSTLITKLKYLLIAKYFEFLMLNYYLLNLSH